MNAQVCWICGGNPETGEHMIKRTDVTGVFGPVTQNAPLYFHDEKRKNQKVQSAKSDILKSPNRICQHCNGARTQPHDRAWEVLSPALQARMGAETVRANKIFPYDTAKQMLNMHLYFVKLLGDAILAGSVPIEIASFAAAIIQQKAHPNVYLKFGFWPDIERRTVGRSDIQIAERVADGKCAFATWLYHVDRLFVNVMFALDGEKREGLANAWHPRLGTNKLHIIRNS